MQFPTVPEEWVPIGCQYLDATVSTAPTLPALPGGQIAKGAIYVCVLTAQVVGLWVRTDGQAVTAFTSGGRKMLAADFEVLYGKEAITKLRLIRDAAGGGAALEYYYFRRTGSE